MPSLFGACLCVAAGTLMTKPLLSHVEALPAVLVQVLASLLVIGPAAALTGRWPKLRRDWRLGLPGLLQPGLSYGLIFAGLALIPASIAGLLFASEAGLVAMLAWPILGERPNPVVFLSIGASTIGIVMLTGVGVPSPMISPIGTVLVLAGILCAALDTIAARAMVIKADPLSMAVAVHLAALLVISANLSFVAANDWQWVGDARLLGVVALSGLLLHGIATIWFNRALQLMSAAVAASLFPVISLLIAVGGILLFNEKLLPSQIYGAIIILIATFSTGYLKFSADNVEHSME